ncbi:hypothetical protein A6V39_01660 [Candidatus Mycoplasma haematobovis]|uniref:DNA 3'-5' helicase n=1 Tax=Candidatus Mycoplasma haematobovis TaxID=432608 RepID=A0A1A9QG77_9MOLU|nr:ATP-dependent helicase [Candidatus Mycoplasma haematobovis]OAL10749.1 hypothetical protein A6V39_01660 [Candidatus Mycoplasma haematobovis]
MEWTLNEKQKEAVYAPLNSHTLVIAPAGTGKTEVLVSRILYLLENSIRPEEICAITFTNYAANEMLQRIKEKFNDVRRMPIAIGTLHSLYGQMLRYDIDDLNTSLDYRFKIADELQQCSILENKEIKVISNFKYIKQLRKLSNLISKHKVSKHLNPQNTTDLEKEGLVSVYEKYEMILRRRKMVDYDDLLIYMDKLFEENPRILNYWRNKYRVVLVDECQDLSLLQFKLITRLIGENSIFFGVGDPHQCIYAFAGAQKNIFKKFKAFFKNKNYVQIDLLENYRSTRKIVDYSNQIKLFEPYAKVVKDEEGLVEVISVPDLIEKLKTEDLSQWVVLFKENKHADFLIKHAIENGIPFKASLFKLIERDEIQIIISYLRLIYFNNFNSFWRLVQLKSIELSGDARWKLFKINPTGEHLTLYARWIEGEEQNWFDNPEDCEKLNTFLRKIKELRTQDISNLSKLAESLIPHLFKVELKGIKKESISLFIKWLDNIQPEKTRESAEKIVLDIENKAKFFKEPEENEDPNYLTLITIYKSKGLGWNNVAVLEYDLLQECARRRDEENEFLEYVSVTRAKTKLFLIK